MANAGGSIDNASDPVRNTDRLSLRFAGRVAQSVDLRVFCIAKNLGSTLNTLIHSGRLTFNQATGAFFRFVVQKPGLTQNTRTFCFGDRVSLDLQFDIVTDTSTEGTGGILHNFQFPARCGGGRIRIGTHDIFSSFTSIPLLVGMPEPWVSAAIRRLERSP